MVDGLADLGEALGRGPVVEPQLLGELPDRGASGADAELEAAVGEHRQGVSLPGRRAGRSQGSRQDESPDPQVGEAGGHGK